MDSLISLTQRIKVDGGNVVGSSEMPRICVFRKKKGGEATKEAANLMGLSMCFLA